MDTFQGKLKAEGFKIGIVLSRYNQFISERLLEGALDALEKLGADKKDISVYKVPGSFEIPVITKKLADSKKVDGIICIGALIRGDTPHFEYLSAEVTKGLAQISMQEWEEENLGKRLSKFYFNLSLMISWRSGP